MNLSPRNSIAPQDSNTPKTSSSSDNASVPPLKTASSLSDAMRQKLDRNRTASGLSLDPCILLPPHATNQNPMDCAEDNTPGSIRLGKSPDHSGQARGHRHDVDRLSMALGEGYSSDPRLAQNANYTGRLETAALYLNPAQP